MGVIHVTDRAGQRHTLEASRAGGSWRSSGTGAADRGPVRRRLRMRHLPCLRRRGLAGKALSCHRRGGGSARHGPITQPNSRLSCQILWTPELDGLEVTLAPTGAADRHPAILPKTKRPCFRKGLSKEPVHDRPYRNGRRHHRRRARGPVRRVRARPPRYQGPPHRHPAEGRAANAPSSIRKSRSTTFRAFRWSPARASSTT